MAQPDLLRGLGQDAIDQVLEIGTRMVLPAGTMLFGLGDLAENIYLVKRGRIALTLPIQVRGTEQDILIDERVPGQSVGWSALIPPHRFTLTATAPLDAEVIALPRLALVEHFRDRPEVGYAIAWNVAGVVGQRLQVFQAMWLREMQRAVDRHATPAPFGAGAACA